MSAVIVIQYTHGGIPDDPLVFRDEALALDVWERLWSEEGGPQGKLLDRDDEPLLTGVAARQVGYMCTPGGDDEWRYYENVEVQT